MKSKNYNKIMTEIDSGFNSKKSVFKYLNKKKRIKHIEKVRQISKMLCIMFDVENNEKNIVDIGAKLHDVGKQIRKKALHKDGMKSYKKMEHNKSGALIAEKIFEYLDNKLLSEEERTLIINIIKYHRGSLDKDFFEQSPRDQKLILIVRLADIISKVYKLEEMFKELDNSCLRIN